MPSPMIFRGGPETSLLVRSTRARECTDLINNHTVSMVETQIGTFGFEVFRNRSADSIGDGASGRARLSCIAGLRLKGVMAIICSESTHESRYLYGSSAS